MVDDDFTPPPRRSRRRGAIATPGPLDGPLRAPIILGLSLLLASPRLIAAVMSEAKTEVALAWWLGALVTSAVAVALAASAFRPRAPQGHNPTEDPTTALRDLLERDVESD